MVLEATMIVLDNSEWMRNGDFTPSRLEAQADTVNILFRSKTGSNPENTVGIMCMADKGPEVLVTLTSDLGKILNAVMRVKMAGSINLTTSIQVAQLALKHRQNKNQRQRIILFVGSPIVEGEKELIRIAKKLKKNNVAVDVINFGEADMNQAKLEAFIENVNNSNNSNLLTAYPGIQLLSDLVISSPIISEDGAIGSTRGGEDFEFGVDPSIDPELAMALRLSLEEEQARQRALNTSAPNDDQSKEEVSKPIDYNETDEDMDLKRALTLSLMEHQESELGGSSKPEDTIETLQTLPGVDMEDPRIQEVFAMLSDEKKDKKDKKEDEDQMED